MRLIITLLLTFLATVTRPVQGQTQEISKKLRDFSRIIVSPKINLVLTAGQDEGIRIVYNNVHPGDIHFEVSGRTLHLYLERARYIQHREQFVAGRGPMMYRDAVVTAYVSYRTLQRLEVRGEEEVTVQSDIAGKKFKLKAYGESEITFASISTDKFKAGLYGRNKVVIRGGEVEEQVYHCYGENKIDARRLQSAYITSHLYGEDRLQLQATDEVRIMAFGEPTVDVSGTPHVHRGLVIGRPSINRR